METIGSKIRIQRLMKNYSQYYMAYALDISQAAYSNIESDKTEPTLKRIYEIAEILQISPFILMPPPKYGTGINLHWFYRMLQKLKMFFNKNIRKRKEEAEARGFLYRDISKNLD